jgi:hypothetical protein
MGPPGVVLACGIKNECPERLGGRVRLEPAHSCSVGVALVPMMAVGLAALLGLMWLLAALYARTLGRRSVFEEAFVKRGRLVGGTQRSQRRCAARGGRTGKCAQARWPAVTGLL